MNVKPKLFIGSSVEGLNIAYAVQQNLMYDVEVTVWDQGVFELSQTTIESLVALLDKCDFGVFIFSADDITKIRKKEFLTVRDNVIFELGLFIGKLGRSRTFIITPDKPALHIPTDLLGINTGKYDTSRSDGSFQAATGPVCHQIKLQIKKLGVIVSQTSEGASEDVSETVEEGIKTDEDTKKKDWWSHYFDKDYKSAIESIDASIEVAESNESRKELEFWKINIQFRLDAKEAKNYINKIIGDKPDEKYNYAAVTRILLWEEEFAMSAEIITKGLEKFPDDPVLISRKAEYLEKIGKLNEAITLMEDANVKDNEEFSIRLADYYEKCDPKKLLDAYNIILENYKLHPNSETIIYKLARLAQENGKESNALYLFDKLIKLKVDNSTYWTYFGNSCVHLGLVNKSMIAYKKAKELSNSKEGWILANIGNVLKNQGFYADAREYFDLALSIEKNSEYTFNRISENIKLEQEEDEKFDRLLKEGLSNLNT